MYDEDALPGVVNEGFSTDGDGTAAEAEASGAAGDVTGESGGVMANGDLVFSVNKKLVVPWGVAIVVVVVAVVGCSDADFGRALSTICPRS